ncbi:hypothetical protein QYF61_012477 [Mycteria americana]|uniref:Reverse transcriptase domain-containing protein n=9 Tax=Neoaves TaxID=3078114 RepID=A0AAN7NHN6_MYCAM|nr:hypothetical protein QYF61_012477 [Mycteria americana]
MPKDLKIANVTPIFRKDKKEDPVSSTLIPRKVMGQIIPEIIYKHMKDKKVVMISQHGYMKGKLGEPGRWLDVFYLAFTKAFDTISHNILIDKWKKHRLDKWTERAVTLFLPPGGERHINIFHLCLALYHFFDDLANKNVGKVSWFSPSQHLGTTQPLAHPPRPPPPPPPPVGWGRESEEQKSNMSCCIEMSRGRVMDKRISSLTLKPNQTKPNQMKRKYKKRKKKKKKRRGEERRGEERRGEERRGEERRGEERRGEERRGEERRGEERRGEKRGEERRGEERRGEERRGEERREKRREEKRREEKRREEKRREEKRREEKRREEKRREEKRREEKRREEKRREEKRREEKRREKARQGKARQGKARQGKARQGKARQGKARQGKARQGKARQGKARQGKARQGKARQGKARKGKERKGKERKGKERKGKERKGKERKGKERKGKNQLIVFKASAVHIRRAVNKFYCGHQRTALELHLSQLPMKYIPAAYRGRSSQFDHSGHLEKLEGLKNQSIKTFQNCLQHFCSGIRGLWQLLPAR